MWGDVQILVRSWCLAERFDDCYDLWCTLEKQLQALCRVADWFASLNNKMGGDLKKIQTVGEYFVEVWKAVGMQDLGEKVSPVSTHNC